MAEETATTEGNGKGKKVEIETVKMQDGREVGFAGKRKLLKDGVKDGNKIGVRLDFRNGETRTYFIPEGLLQDFAVHGAKQKYGDETAGMTDIDDMVLAVDSLDEQIQAGKWREEREGGGMAGTSVLLKALVEYSKKSVEEVKAFLKDKSPAEKLALRNSKTLKPIVDRIESEKAARVANVDTDSLLGQLA